MNLALNILLKGCCFQHIKDPEALDHLITNHQRHSEANQLAVDSLNRILGLSIEYVTAGN